MVPEKKAMAQHVGPLAEEGTFETPGDAVFQKGGTKHDGKDMDRMGKLQQLRRNFRFFTIFSYAVLLGCTWEFALLVISISLLNGGTAGGIWMFLVVCVGMFFVVLSMAEMASMAPTSGGQYHWVSEFAPAKTQKFLSYVVGWFTTIGWQAAMPTVAFGAAQQIEGLIALNMPSYKIQGWHGTLLTIAITLVAVFWNTYLVRQLPLLEKVAIVIHFSGFFAFLAVLWALGPRSDPKEVWTDFQDNAGWGSTGLSCLVGIIGPVVTLIGADSACHLSEELKDASYVLPRSMLATALFNYIMAFLMTVTVMTTVGNVEDVLSSPTGQPYIQVLLNATNSKAGTSVMTAIVAVMFLICGVNQVTTSSRQLFAFARDRGLPFSSFLAYVRPGWDIPVNAILVTLLSTALLSLIIIGSPIAFNVILSIGQIGLLSSYMVAIACIARKRLVGEELLPSRFNLGRLGLPVNIIALCFLLVAFTLVFFPATPKPSPEAMNWAVLVAGGTMVVALIYYFAKARHTYLGPVAYVKRV